jgi:hypothetical protein
MRFRPLNLIERACIAAILYRDWDAARVQKNLTDIKHSPQGESLKPLKYLGVVIK